MVNSMVERATSDMLIGPDWAMNIEICDICNRDPSQAKDVVKGIKKRLGSRNSKVQLLALTLLETIVKNCGDFVHLHVAERDVLHEMVRIVKKKPDFHVKEKILILIDTWQEAFGGARARYPQYYAAYQELLRMGAVFPQKSERTAPVFTPPQTQPLTSYPHNLRNIENGNEAAESSAEAEFPTLSLTEIQNARGIMDVLTEMLTAIDPENKEGLRQEVIVDLVEQCRTYKQRVVHLVNSTSDESLLCQGLALNDDLQRLLAKHESLVSGTAVPGEKPKNETSKALVPVDAPLIDTGDSKQPDTGSTSIAASGLQLVSLAPITTNVPSTTPVKVNPKFDLLSGDDFGSPTAENSLALVPTSEAQPTTASQQNALALVDMFSQSNNMQSNSPVGHAYSSSPQFHQQPQGFQQSPFYPNGSVPTVGQPPYEQQSPYAQGNSPAWNQMPQQQPQQPHSPVYGGQSSGALPPPPWEAQPADSGQYGSPQYPQPVQVTTQVVVTHSAPLPNNMQPMGPTDPQITGMYMQTFNNQAIHPQQLQGGAQPMGMLPQQLPPGQMSYMYPQQLPPQMYNNQMGGGYGYGYGYNYGQQQQNTQFLEQRMSGLSVRDDGLMKNPSYYSTQSSYVPVPSGKPSRPEDKLFGDLVDFAKVNPSTKNTTTTPSRAGSM